jgi:KDO2-lipid IV(A) lauroyltransferase
LNDPLPAEPRTPRRWTLHGLNTGGVFSVTYHGVRMLPRPVSYLIGHAGASLVARFAPRATAALADNLRALFPDESEAQLRARALETYRSYTRDTIDFLRALDDPRIDEAFEFSEDTRRHAMELYGGGRGAILVTGHYGNWEAGGLLMARVLKLPLTVVAMREADATVNRIRNEIRERMGIETVEVRQSLDTPLKIRAALARNRFVAILVDRHHGRDRVPVTFLGRPASLLRTPLLIAAMTGAPVAVSMIERLGPGRFHAWMGPPMSAPPGLPREQGITVVAQQVADYIGERVRARPQCWYHFYRYWDAQRDEYDGLE